MLRGQEEMGCANTRAVRRNSYWQSAALTHTMRWRVKEQRRGKIQQATNCVALNPEGNHSNGCGLINLGNLGRDGVGSFMAVAPSHAARIIFQQKGFLLYMDPIQYDTNSLKQEMSPRPRFYTLSNSNRFMNGSAVVLHNPNSMNS